MLKSISFTLSKFIPMEIELDKYEEYRIEVAETQKLKVMITAGLAEVKGQELLNDKWYVFSDLKIPIFTFTGAKIKIDGKCDLQYKAEKTSFTKIFKYFHENKDSNKSIIVLGKGRTTFCSTISNYFVRMHKTVDFVELDPSKGNVFPGALSLLHIDTFVDFQEGFKLNNPICYFYGSTIVENKELYDLQTSSLAGYLYNRNEPTKQDSFKIILAPELSCEEINSLIKKFKVEEIIIIGDERLYHRMDFIVPKYYIECSGYICENNMSKSISRYFNGPNNEFTPCSFMVKYDWEVVRIGEQFSAPESALPIGSTRKVGKTDICKADLIENAVLAISEADNEESIVTSPVVGFVVCLNDKKLRILCAQQKLPKLKYLIQGDIKYLDF